MSVWQEVHQSLFSLSAAFLTCFLLLTKKIKFNGFDGFFITFISFCILHLFINNTNYINHSIAGVIYISAAWFTNKLTEIYDTQDILKTIAITMLTVSSFSLLIQIYQILGIAWKYDPWMMPLPLNSGARPSANIGQPNILASIYISTLALLFWSSKENLLRIQTLFLYSFFIAFGIALTQSRVGYLSLIALSFIFLLQKNSSRMQKFFFPFVLLCSLTAAEMIAATTSIQRELTEDLNNGRFAIWSDSLLWIKNAPLLGYGFNETARASISFAEFNKFSNQSLAHAHNIFLDFLIWFGIPIGGLLSLFIIGIGFYMFYKAYKNKNLFPILVLTPFTLHAMLELPLYYANTLILFGFFTGLACKSLETKTSYSQTTSNIYKIYLIFITSIAILFAWENIKLEQDRFEQRNYYYGLNQADWKESDKVYLADLTYDFQSLLKIRPEDTWSKENIKKAEKVSMYITSPRLYFSIIDFYNGKDEEKFNYWLSKGIHRLSKDDSEKLKEKYNQPN